MLCKVSKVERIFYSMFASNSFLHFALNDVKVDVPLDESVKSSHDGMVTGATVVGATLVGATVVVPSKT